jgi:homoaconitase/3-isopropylmalate dehydratase large subunit
MAMTMSEKILAKKSAKASVAPGDLVTAHPDVIMSNDITTAMSAVILKEHGIERLADPDKL